ncbi:ribosome maturation factor RimP [Deinococcus radiopugnans]|uniref:Ribosome maturation factor RimP n=1 Tax=Deinococcus radiopugnans ATCC 19172 TaxID=585398 RepID=A0A5C4Y6A3_9DEIO|nr:ribosome maturation factor RimP [Deinococcus radiopugnans]MBB6016610.1 ribosome maturation factor RimP [Deinococcus radiopugnans ATCC 19172]TNM71070.1 ribosome maturation factor RimP [Deinococcus radiopugnans ATCC 19172]
MNNNATDNSDGQTANNSGGQTDGQIARLQAIAQAGVEPLGFEVLEVQLQHAGGELIVLVRIDRLDEQPVTMADITGASRAAEAEFDRLDPIAGEYRLEFESPGAKRPLLRARHFERMVGLKTRVRGDGQAFTAPIKAVNGDDVTFDVNGEDVTLKAGTFTANLAEFPDRHR